MGWAAKMSPLLGLADKFHDRAVELAVSVVQSETSLRQGLENELAKLERIQDRISALLLVAEERRLFEEELMEEWPKDLRHVALDAEDVADELEAQLWRPGGDGMSSAWAGRERRPWYAVALAPSPLILFRRRVAAEIKEINERFDDISRTPERRRLRRGEAVHRNIQGAPAPPPAAVLPAEPRVIGRDDVRDEIVRLLLLRGENNNALLVIPIFGMAGLGKTTLAKWVFKDERVARHFNWNRIWICASLGFDVKRITMEILESLTGDDCNLSNFSVMQRRVRELLMGKPFLLVLDDVREEGPRYWESLRASLPAGGGGRVVITTRNEDVARRMGTDIPGWSGRLNGLSDNCCLLLLEEQAFPDGGSDHFPNLREIGVRIARRCQGSPLAAISFGGLLRNETEEAEWESVLEELSQSSQANTSDTMWKLKLAYDHLPVHLKKCFAFCAMFPDGYLFDRDVLVRMWIAEGFVARRGTKRLESMGSEYFDELLLKSFFQVSDRTQHPTVKYIIPSVFHDLAESASKHECFKVVDNQPKPREVSENARHALLLYHGGKAVDFTGFHRYKRLRTFSLKGDGGVSVRKLPSELFLKLRWLRVLDMSDSRITELPASIGELRLLRYLSLRNTWIELLPESAATLCSLQTLDLNHCYKLRGLPEGTSKLLSLRYLGLHLDPHRGSHIKSMPPGIGKLTSLETLSRFIVGTRNGCGISEIKNLSLRGELWISKLENVAGLDDARDANLPNKNYINTLTLQWSDCDQHTVQYLDRVDVIENLQPPSQIKHLCVDNYGGGTVPSWLGNSFLSSLVSLRLSYCKRWKHLPSLGQLPLLEELSIEGMHGVRGIEHQFRHCGTAPYFEVLKKLTLSDFPALEGWPLAERVMLQLSELYISHCPMLVDVPYLPSSLTKLMIKNCGALSTISAPPTLQDLIVEACDWKVLDMVSDLTSLSSLTISQISSLQDIQGSFFKPLIALKRLEITRCKELVSVAANEGLQGLTSLECLVISSCPELALISSDCLPAKLKDLRLCHCCKLTSMPWDLYNLRYLQCMEIRDIPRVMSLPREGVSPSLQHLAISGCPFLAWRCRKYQGRDWPKIKDIFYVEIDFKVLSVNWETDYVQP